MRVWNLNKSRASVGKNENKDERLSASKMPCVSQVEIGSVKISCRIKIIIAHPFIGVTEDEVACSALASQLMTAHFTNGRCSVACEVYVSSVFYGQPPEHIPKAFSVP
jgi:hypothetical protein